MFLQISYNKQQVNALEKDGKSLADLVALEVGSIGENMSLRRGLYIAAAEGNTLASYLHSSGIVHLLCTYDFCILKGPL